MLPRTTACTMISSCLQIVWGSPDVRSWVPEGSVVYIENMSALSAVAQHVQAALTDEALYLTHHRWRTLPLPLHFVELATHGFNHIVCGSCDAWYAQRNTSKSASLASTRAKNQNLTERLSISAGKKAK